MKTRCKTKKFKNKGMNTIKNTPVKHIVKMLKEKTFCLIIQHIEGLTVFWFEEIINEQEKHLQFSH